MSDGSKNFSYRTCSNIILLILKLNFHKLITDGFLQYHNWRDITPAKLNFSVPLPTVQISTTVVEATTMPQNKTIDASLPSTPVPEPTSKNTNAHVVTGSTPEPGSVVPQPTAEPTTQPTTTSGSCHLHFNKW